MLSSMVDQIWMYFQPIMDFWRSHFIEISILNVLDVMYIAEKVKHNIVFIKSKMFNLKYTGLLRLQSVIAREI